MATANDNIAWMLYFRDSKKRKERLITVVSNSNYS